MPEQNVALELMALSNDASQEMRKIESTLEDNNYDEEYKRGARDAFHKVVEMVQVRIEKHLIEQK